MAAVFWQGVLMEFKQIGFVGLGVMGAPICGHIARYHAVLAYDQDPSLSQVDGLAELAQCDLLLFCLPNGEAVRALTDELLGLLKPGALVADLGTSPVPLTKALGEAFAAKAMIFADCPITRTRQAAIDGTLSTLVGGERETFERLEPVLRCFSEEVTHCGPLGAGQVFKQMNNMVLFQTVHALAEALATVRAAGYDGDLLFEAMSKGSADSFALRNHGAKALLKDTFPKRAFSSEYALKDLCYALDLAEAEGLQLTGAEACKARLLDAIEDGYGADYFPTIIKTINP